MQRPARLQHTCSPVRSCARDGGVLVAVLRAVEGEDVYKIGCACVSGDQRGVAHASFRHAQKLTSSSRSVIFSLIWQPVSALQTSNPSLVDARLSIRGNRGCEAQHAAMITLTPLSASASSLSSSEPVSYLLQLDEARILLDLGQRDYRASSQQTSWEYEEKIREYVPRPANLCPRLMVPQAGAYPVPGPFVPLSVDLPRPVPVRPCKMESRMSCLRHAAYGGDGPRGLPGRGGLVEG